MWSRELLFIFDRVMEHPLFVLQWRGEEGAASCAIIDFLRSFSSCFSSTHTYTHTEWQSYLLWWRRLRPLTRVYQWVHRLVITSASEQLRWICAVAAWCDYSTDLFFQWPLPAVNQTYLCLQNNMFCFLLCGLWGWAQQPMVVETLQFLQWLRLGMGIQYF